MTTSTELDQQGRDAFQLGAPANSIEKGADMSLTSGKVESTRDELENEVLDTESADKSRTSDTASPSPSEDILGNQTILSFAKDDPQYPHNWKQSKKTCQYFLVLSRTFA